MSQRTRRTIIAAAVLAGTVAALAWAAEDVRDGPLLIEARPLPLNPADLAQQQVGALRYMGGVQLSSPVARFGGLSGLHVRADDSALALSDQGDVFAFRIVERDGRPVSIDDARMVALRDSSGRTGSKADRDSEALLIDDRAATALVAFEGSNSIARYATSGERAWTATASLRPPPMQAWPTNAGAESMVQLPDGRLLLLSEETPGDDRVGAGIVLAAGDDTGERPLRFTYVPPEGFRATDATLLDEQHLLILNRHFTPLTGVMAALTVVAIKDLAEGVRVTGREIARLKPPLSVDNMEGLSLVRDGGRTMIWMVSDDNFSGAQRTLLMKFALAGDVTAAAPRP